MYLERSDVRVIRAKRKTVSITVDKSGTVVVRAPLKTPEKELERILAKHWAKIGAIKESPRLTAPPLRTDDGATVPYMGRTVTIRTLPGAKNCRVEGGELLVPPRFDADGLRGFYSAEVERVYYPLCREYAKKMGVALPPLVITKAKGKWGSCSPKVIRLNFRLAMIDPYSAEGVIVHELSHITVHDHSPRFYAYMAKYMPDHAERKSRLRKWEREDAVFTVI